MVVDGRQLACCLGFGLLLVGCASAPPGPRSGDLVMPAWVGPPPPTPTKETKTKRIGQAEGDVVGDGDGAAPESAPSSGMLNSSANSPYYGGVGAMGKAGGWR